ncbi:hypothetical protein NFI96_029553 [Prochilodus magdalenae]|nr:hypothetical protein NFI96_029553 [Prochilodus magdalenae]
MIYGLIPQELYAQLLDLENYQNRTNGVEELKNILSNLDFKIVSSDSIVEFIHFLHRLLDDTNFKVLYGTLQVINLLVQKLNYSMDRYYKQIIHLSVKMLGDTRTVTRNEYMNVFRQLMRIVGPQKVLDLLMGHLKHKNSRVREDVINIITAAMLTHPRKDFNISDLCFVVAPCLADNKKRVRHAALELFAVFDYCLDTGKKQPLMKAIDRVELTGDMDGLMAAVQARRARHILPRLSADGMVEYALVIPKPGQRRRSQMGSGADLDWVLNGGRVNSARSLRTEIDLDGLSGYGSLGSLTDEQLLHRRIVSAGKGKNKLPWERSSLPSTVNLQPTSASNGRTPEKSNVENLATSVMLNQETCVTNFGNKVEQVPFITVTSGGQKSFLKKLLQVQLAKEQVLASTKLVLLAEGSAELLQPHSGGGWGRESMGRLRRSGSLDLASTTDAERGLPKPGRLQSGYSIVERTLSLPSNPTLNGSFLLPSYPLATLPGVQVTSTLPRRCQADSSLSMSNTWPNKQEISPHHREPSPWRDNAGELSSSRCSQLPMRTCRASATSASAFSQTLSAARSSPPIFPVTQLSMEDGFQQDQPGKNLYVDLSFMNLQDPDDEPVDREEMMNSLRSLRNSAAKKRAKVSLSGSEPDSDSPDTAVKLEPAVDPFSHSVISPLSESSLSDLCFLSTPVTNGTKSRPCNSQTAGVPSGKQITSSLMEVNSKGVSQQEEEFSNVSVVGQRVIYSNGPTEEEKIRETTSSHQVRPVGHEPVRALKPTKGSQIHSTRCSPAGDMPEGVVGRGVFGSLVLPTYPSVSKSHEQEDKVTWDHLAGVYGNAVFASRDDLNEVPEPVESVMNSHHVPPRKILMSKISCVHFLNQTLSSLKLSDCLISKTVIFWDFIQCFLVLSLVIFSYDNLFLTQDMCFRVIFSYREKKIEGLTLLRGLAQYHSDVLVSRLHDFCFILIQEVRNLRSGVSRMAIVTLGELYCGLQKGMDQELEATAKALLHKAGESNAFIRQDVDAALDSMVQNCTPSRSMSALLTGGL